MMPPRPPRLLLLLLLLGRPGGVTVQALDNGLGLSGPVMGWSSWCV
jgi:hypothetical protein